MYTSQVEHVIYKTKSMYNIRKTTSQTAVSIILGLKTYNMTGKSLPIPRCVLHNQYSPFSLFNLNSEEQQHANAIWNKILTGAFFIYARALSHSWTNNALSRSP